MAFRTPPGDEVLYHEEAGEAFLLHVPSGEYFGLNKAGVVVWKAVRDGADPEEALARRWPEVPREELRRDAGQLLEALAAAGLLIDSDDSSGL